MTAALLISFRETFEASLVVGIMLAFLHRTQNSKHTTVIWSGVGVGIALSMVLAFVFQKIVGGFTGRSEEIYEGVVMLAAAGLISSMVLWLAMNGKHMKGHIEKRLALHLERNALLSIFLLTLLSILREGIEMTIFLQAAFIQSSSGTSHIGAIAGIVLAIAITYFLFKGMMKWFSLPRFFQVSGVLLLLFASGLVAYGIHELQEAHVVPVIIEHVWDTSAFLSEESVLGVLMKGLFGYNANPSLIEVLSYVMYLTAMSFTWRYVNRSTAQ